MPFPLQPVRVVRIAGRALVLASALVAAACGGSGQPPPPSPGTPGPGGTTITGRERLGWTQQAQDAAQLATFGYAIYVDGARRVMSGETCAAASAGSFDCSAPLPPLTPGPHVLELASFVTINANVIESERSAPLQVTVASATAPADLALERSSTLATSDGHRLIASIVAEGLDDPTDLAVAPDGRVFVTERAGRVAIVGTEHTAPSLSTALELADTAAADEMALTAIALHPAFERNGHVYLAYTAAGREGTSLRVARYRERNGLLAQGAMVARELSSSARTYAVARFGMDGRLYVGLAAGDDPRAAQSASSPLGKILRFNEDGSTPRDNPRASPVFSSGHADLRALAWQPGTGRLWDVERAGDEGDEVNAIVAGADYGWPRAAPGSRSVPAVLALPPGTGVSGASFVPAGENSPLGGELLVASRGAEDLLRIHVGKRGEAGLIEGILHGRYGRIAGVTASRDGTIYIVTGNRETWGPSRDVLIRISPAPRE